MVIDLVVVMLCLVKNGKSEIVSVLFIKIEIMVKCIGVFVFLWVKKLGVSVLFNIKFGRLKLNSVSMVVIVMVVLEWKVLCL